MAPLFLRRCRRAIINPGSVGLPRDGASSVARFGVLHPRQNFFEFKSVSYDDREFKREIHEEGFDLVY
jgi:hypothetical protein